MIATLLPQNELCKDTELSNSDIEMLLDQKSKGNNQEPAKDRSKSKWLVTGGAGFIGSHLVESLVNQGQNVKVLDNFLTGKRENLTDFVDRIDLIDILGLSEA